MRHPGTATRRHSVLDLCFLFHPFLSSPPPPEARSASWCLRFPSLLRRCRSLPSGCVFQQAGSGCGCREQSPSSARREASAGSRRRFPAGRAAVSAALAPGPRSPPSWFGRHREDWPVQGMRTGGGFPPGLVLGHAADSAPARPVTWRGAGLRWCMTHGCGGPEALSPGWLWVTGPVTTAPDPPLCAGLEFSW